MKKIINQPDNYIKEMLEGIYIAHKDDLACVDGDLQVLVSKHKKEGKVGIVTGGGIRTSSIILRICRKSYH